MESFECKLAITTIALVFFVASVTNLTNLCKSYINHPRAWRRIRHHTLKTMTAGIMLR